MRSLVGFMAPENPLEAMRMMHIGYKSFGRPALERYANAILASINDSSCAHAMSHVVASLRGDNNDAVGFRMAEASGLAPQGLFGGNPAMLGDYDECLTTHAASFSGQYCLATACLSPDDRPCESLYFAAVAARAHRAFAEASVTWAKAAPALERLPLRVGLCVPSACGAGDVRALAQRSLRPLHPALRVDLAPAACRVAGDAPFAGYDYLVLGLLMIMIFWCAIATVYEYSTRGRRRNEWVAAFSALVNGTALLCPGGGGGGDRGGDRVGGRAGGRGSGKGGDKGGDKGGGKGSGKGGGKRGGKGGGKGGGDGDGEGRDSLPPLHALRVIGFLAVVLGHCLVSCMDVPTANLEHFYELSKEPIAVILAVTPLFVDVYLVLGGLLVAYVFFNHVAQGGEFQLLPFYLYRYVRLTPALAVLVLLQTSVIMKINDGPLWRMQHAQQCPETWWYIMLHICNYFRPEAVRCLGHLWYLSLDWHMYIVSPVLLLALRRSPRRALVALGALVAGGVVARFAQAYALHLRLPWTPNGQEEALKRLYFATHSRFEPYLVGIVLGYALHHLKRRSSPLILSQMQVAVVWTVEIVSVVLLARETWLFGNPDQPYEQLHESAFLAVVHVGTALTTAVLVFMIMAGYGGVLASIFCHRWWRPLSRLTYCMYLVHYPVLQSIVWNTRTPLVASCWTLFKMMVTVWFLSMPFAFILAVVFECPIVQIARLLFAWHMKRVAQAKAAKIQKNGDYVIIRNDSRNDHYLSQVKILKE